MNEMVLPCAANGFKPPVKSISLRKRGQTKAVRLVSYDSLMAYLRSFLQEGVVMLIAFLLAALAQPALGHATILEVRLQAQSVLAADCNLPLGNTTASQTTNQNVHVVGPDNVRAAASGVTGVVAAMTVTKKLDRASSGIIASLPFPPAWNHTRFAIPSSQNAIVPQVAEQILKAIIKSETNMEKLQTEMGLITPSTQTTTSVPITTAWQPPPNPVTQPAEVSAPAPSKAVELPEVEMWPDPVNGAEVLDAIAEAFSRYVVLPAGAAEASVLWTAHTHCCDVFQCTPRLNLSSPEKGCGKSTLRDVIGLFVPRPLSTEHLTPAVLFRLIDGQQPTVLADECDAWLLENENLRGLLNAGHRRGGQVFRYDGKLGAVRGFSVHAPVVLCGIGKLPGTLHDRSIIIPLERARPGEIRERFDSRRTEREIELHRKLARFCADNRARLEQCDPVLPAGASNRLADNWRPLFAIAEIAGGNWPGRVATAFAKLAVKDKEEQGTGAMLLADIQQVFTTRKAVRMSSQSLVEALCAMPERPWLEAHKGHRINEIWLAASLRAYRITPTTIRIGRICKKGYQVADFKDAFERYAPQVELSSRNSVTMSAEVGDYEI